MKRYYDEDGEPDVAKTLWAFLTKCLWGLALLCGICALWNYTHRPVLKEAKPHWSNWDSSRHLSEVKWYDYSNGIIHYRGEDSTLPKDIEPYSNSKPSLVILVDGKRIQLNISAEELLDQLMDDTDFYEYLERNLD